jgi:hypothetical protein
VWNDSQGVAIMPWEAEKLIRGWLGRALLWSFLVGLCCTLNGLIYMLDMVLLAYDYDLEELAVIYPTHFAMPMFMAPYKHYRGIGRVRK